MKTIQKYPKQGKKKFKSKIAMYQADIPHDKDTIQADVIVSPFYWVFISGNDLKVLNTNKEIDRHLDGYVDAEKAEIGCMYIHKNRRYEFGRMWLKRFYGKWVVDKYMRGDEDY